MGSDLDDTQRRPRKKPDADRPTDPSRARAVTPAVPPDDDRTEPPRPRSPRPAASKSATAAPPARSRPQEPAVPGRPRAAVPVGAIPTAPRGEATATDVVVDRAQRDWRWTGGAVAAAIACGVAGIALVGSGHRFTGAAALVAALPLILAALLVRRAPCPSCGKPIIVMSIEQCEHCNAFIYVENEILKSVEPGYVASMATFPLKVPLPVVPRLTWPEDARCCVCGEPAGNNQTIDVQGTRIVLPHCGDHENGVEWDLALGSDATTMVTFKFRNYDAWLAMSEANSQHLRGGMWR